MDAGFASKSVKVGWRFEPLGLYTLLNNFLNSDGDLWGGNAAKTSTLDLLVSPLIERRRNRAGI